MFGVFSVVMLFADTIVGLVFTYSLSVLVFTSNPALIAFMIQLTYIL